MKIQIQEIEKAAVIKIVGNVMHEEVTQLKNRFDEIIFRNQKNLIIDLENTEYISSLCLALFVEVKKKVSLHHGELKLVNPGRVVKALFEITNLNKKFDIYSTVDEALESF